PSPSSPCPAKASDPRYAPANNAAKASRQMGVARLFVRPARRHAPSRTPNANRNCQANPNCVCERTVQTVPSAMTSPIGLPAIRAANKQSQAKPDANDKAKLIHSTRAVLAQKATAVVAIREPLARKIGEAIMTSKKIMPATITVETKWMSRTAISGLIRVCSMTRQLFCVTAATDSDQPAHPFDWPGFTVQHER